MQLDQTRIAIRERGLWELMDLSLRTTILYIGPLLKYTALLALPLAAFNWWATHGIVAEEYSQETNLRHIWIMAQLVFLEAQLATSATTLYLGRVMFLDAVTFRSIIADLWRFSPRIVWTQLIVRGGVAAFILGSMVSTDASYGPADVFLPVLCIYTLILRSTRPFINEVVLLEQNPIRSNRKHAMTVGRRSRALHAASSGDLIIRWILMAIACVFLTACLSAAFWFLAGAMTSQWGWRAMMVEFLIPLSMWLIAVYATVTRFLNYLDLRIRREGWEVELKVRTAANELRGQPA